MRKAKKFIIPALFIIILFIPTYFAIYTYFTVNNMPVEESSVTSVDFYDTNGNITSLSRDNAEGQALISLLMDVHSNSKSVTALPEDLIGTNSIKAIFYSYDIKSTYTYYFSSVKPSNSYYVDPDGNVFRIDANSAIAFLDSDFSASLYSGSIVPTLTVNSKLISPTTGEWVYSTYSNVSHVSNMKTTEKIITLSSSYKECSFIFDKYPSEATINVIDSNGALFYNGSFEDFVESEYLIANVKKTCTLNVTISAKWQSDTNNAYVGEATYRFILSLEYDPDANFWLSETKIESGEFVVITGANIDDISAISFKSTPELTDSPVFYTDGEYVRALLAIDYDLGNDARVYDLEISYNELVTTLTLNVEPTSAAQKTRKYNYSDKLNTGARNEKSLTEFAEFISSLPYEETVYFSGAFLLPDESMNRARFADIINNTSKESDKFVSKGTAFVSYKGDKIYATNYGKVIAVEQTAYGGLTIVIDHGLGLRSVYYCLGTSTVSVGAYVSPGMQVGTGGGKNGYTDGYTCYFELWIRSTPVSYYAIADGGRTGEIVYGSNDK